MSLLMRCSDHPLFPRTLTTSLPKCLSCARTVDARARSARHACAHRDRGVLKNSLPSALKRAKAVVEARGKNTPRD